MIHFVTVHFESPRWIDIQLAQIARHTGADYKVWGCLNGIDASFRTRFDEVVDLDGKHEEKLNALAELVHGAAAPDDIIVFIDGDAFPIDDLTPVWNSLSQYPLVAVKRPENVGDPQPHPCFTATTVEFWHDIGGDWRHGAEWTTTFGKRTDVGARVMEALDERKIEWRPLLRSNTRDLHPVMFGVYADVVYHHGCGFRNALTAADSAKTGYIRWHGTKLHRFVSWRRDRRAAKNRKISERVYAEIARDPSYVRRFFLANNDGAPATPQVASGR